ncbi:hypothetical protein AALP_AA3G105300 [Arabis alpina]|uniref:Isopropylmalate dehydrogenase-like domain-containing protein n=1 Tax=Arabis alpina TaxID=50452 RepID=A0A087H8B9_ARAAL|nr:hypothetical protein AALP_AA3G105300 [Arabis alpina]
MTLLVRRMIGRSNKILITTNSSSGPLVGRAFSSSIIPITVFLFPGDAIGLEMAESLKQVFNVASAPIQWEEYYIGTEIDPRTRSFFTWECLESLRRNKVGLNGPMEMPWPSTSTSRAEGLFRKEIQFYAKVWPCFSIPGYKTHYDDVNLIIIRENTRGRYSGIEHQVVKGVVQSLNIIIREASLKIAEYAFHYAKTQGRKKVSAIHKANIMQKTDGLFLECCQEVAMKYPEIIYEEVVIDTCCMMLVKNPSVFDVLVMPNLYGDIISNLCAGLVGGIRLTPSCNIGEGGIALAEVSGEAKYGFYLVAQMVEIWLMNSAPDIAGKNLANPTAMLLSGVMLLRHLELNETAEQIQNAVIKTIAEGKHRTSDLGGTSTTTEFTNAICDHL